MAEIRDIGIRNVDIRQVIIPDRFAEPPRVPSVPPVTEQVGVPVIDIPVVKHTLRISMERIVN